MPNLFPARCGQSRLSNNAMVLATLFLIVWVSPTFAQSTATKPDAAQSAAAKKGSSQAGGGIEVGQTFPAVKLKDQTGQVFDFAAALKKGPVALVIFRSADW